MTRRSSSEWKEIAANRPPGRSTLPHLRQRGVELEQLVVDRDPQRLEGAPRGVAAGELRRHGNRGLDHVDELLCGDELLAVAGPNDRAGDAVGVALLAVFAEEPRQPALVPRR